MDVFKKLIGRRIEGIRWGTICSYDEEQCEDVVELTLDNGEVVLLGATDNNAERYYSTFFEAMTPEEQIVEEGSDPQFWPHWNPPLEAIE